jgi:ERCC4-type nuclease
MNETAELLLNMTHKINKDLKKGKKACYQNRILKVEPNADSPENTEIIVDENHGGNVSNEKKEDSNENYCSVVKKVKKENITKENIGEIVLCQIPGISSINAIAIMKNFESFPHFMEEILQNPDVLNNMTYETNGTKRKISKKIIENIKLYFTKSA